MKNPRNLVALVLVILTSFLAGYWFHRAPGAGTASAGGRKILYYVDPMHPAHRSDKPGIAPDCGMKLEPAYEDDAAGEDSPEKDSSFLLPAGTVHITPEKQQLIGVRVGAVEKTGGTQTVRVPGRIAADERRVYRLNTATDGWIKAAFQNSTGSLVKKDELLATYYAPEFLGVEQAYIFALNSVERLGSSGQATPDQIAISNVSVKQAADSLRNLGMGEVQLQALARDRRLTQDIELRSPATAFVLTRNVSPGQRFERGKELYALADLSEVWILADLSEGDTQWFRPGVVARVRLPYQSGAFNARVSDVLPQFDPESRTLRIRLEAENPGYLLRPGMFVDVELPVKFPPAITVPADAVLDSGLQKIVFVDRGHGYFEPREVETGWRSGGRIEILKGLKLGERIVTAGNFLLDSESRMKLSAARLSAPSAPPGAAGAKLQDPVCGMEVKEAAAQAAGWKSESKGQTYYFCSAHCKQLFDQDSGRYLAKASGTEAAPHD